MTIISALRRLAGLDGTEHELRRLEHRAADDLALDPYFQPLQLRVVGCERGAVAKRSGRNFGGPLQHDFGLRRPADDGGSIAWFDEIAVEPHLGALACVRQENHLQRRGALVADGERVLLRGAAFHVAEVEVTLADDGVRPSGCVAGRRLRRWPRSSKAAAPYR